MKIKLALQQIVMATFLFAAWSIPALAMSLCTFVSECTEDAGCQATAYSLEFRAGTGGPFEFELVTETETIGVTVGGSGKVAHLAGMTETGFHVLTIVRDTGAARYSRHISDGPRAVTYRGRCEVGQ